MCLSALSNTQKLACSAVSTRVEEERRRGRRIARCNELAISKNRRRWRRLQRRLRGEILSSRASRCGSVPMEGVGLSGRRDWQRKGCDVFCSRDGEVEATDFRSCTTWFWPSAEWESSA